jgi:hypothetical protein
MGASGISTSFLELSQTSGQVSHVLLTRSPLGLPQCCHWMDPARLACIRHAASVRPEPGSNSPSKSLSSRRARSLRFMESRRRRGFLVDRLAPEQTSDVRFSAYYFERSPQLDAVTIARTRLVRPLFRFQGAPDASERRLLIRRTQSGGERGCGAVPLEPHRPVVRLVLCPPRAAAAYRCWPFGASCQPSWAAPACQVRAGSDPQSPLGGNRQ